MLRKPPHPQRPRRWRIVSSVGVAWLLGVCLATLCCAPAAWLAELLATATGGRMQLLQVRGSVWQGSGQWVLSDGHGGLTALALPQRVHWQLKPVWNGIQLSIHAECCTRTPWVWRWHPGWNGGHVSLQAHTSQWPLAWLSGLGAPWNTLGLQGQIRLQHADMQWSWRAGQAMLQGSGEMTLQNVSSDLSTLKPLGDYALSLQGGPQPELQLRSLQARLQLQGRGGWRDGHWYLNGEAQADRAYEQVLGNLLGVLGQRQGHKAIFQWG